MRRSKGFKTGCSSFYLGLGIITLKYICPPPQLNDLTKSFRMYAVQQ